jgi:hypothetical protein
MYPKDEAEYAEKIFHIIVPSFNTRVNHKQQKNYFKECNWSDCDRPIKNCFIVKIEFLKRKVLILIKLVHGQKKRKIKQRMLH